MVIGLSSLFISIYVAQIQRKHDRLSVQPHLNVSFWEGDTGAGWGIANDGLGSARIRGFRILIDGVSQPFTDRWFQLLAGPFHIPETKVTFGNPYVGTFVRAGDSPMLVLFHSGAGADILRSDYHRIYIEICYCSIYDECWLATSKDVNNQQDNSCRTFAKEPHSPWWHG
jgi:hypothetical protein